MDLNNSSADYLTYKKSKMNPNRVQRVEKRIEKIKRITKLSLVTFCIMFLCVVVFIKKYAKRVDIEYGRHGLTNAQENQDQGFSGDTYDPDKRSIDKRLTLIQEEENAPSESRVLEKDRDKNEVMNLEQFQKIKAANIEQDYKEEIEKPKQAAPKEQTQSASRPATQTQSQASAQPKLLPKMQEQTTLSVTQNGDYAPVEVVPASIKVLVGRYSNFDDAKLAQASMKARIRVAPFIRKVGSVYTLQIGTYSNMDVARNVAGNYSSMGFDVWIYQQ